jgi:hypothetical protein
LFEIKRPTRENATVKVVSKKKDIYHSKAIKHLGYNILSGELMVDFKSAVNEVKKKKEANLKIYKRSAVCLN